MAQRSAQGPRIIGVIQLDDLALCGILYITTFSWCWRPQVPITGKQNQSKARVLAADGTLNPAPEKVGDPKFQEDGFFDPRDVVQVKYEMLRRVSVDRLSVTEASDEYGVSRPTFYQAKAGFEDAGLAGLMPGKRGPRGPHKLQGEVLAFLREQVNSRRSCPGPRTDEPYPDKVRPRCPPQNDRTGARCKNCVTSAGGSLHCAMQSLATERYEMLRAAILGAALPPEARSGLTILLQRGMWAWVRAISQAPGDCPSAATPPARMPITAETSERRTVIHLLAAMVMAAPERRKTT